MWFVYSFLVIFFFIFLIFGCCSCTNFVDAIRLSLFFIPDECMLWVYCLLFAFLFVFFRLYQSVLFSLKKPSPIVAFEFHNKYSGEFLIFFVEFFSSTRARCFNLLTCVFKRCLLYVLRSISKLSFWSCSRFSSLTCRRLGCHCVFVFSCIFLNFHLDN